MKKIVGLVSVFFLTLIVVPVQAQIRFGVKGGVNISKVHFSDKMVDEIKSSTGFQIGPMMEINVPYTGFGLETGLLYSQKGFEQRDKSFNSDYLDIPLLFKYKLDLPLVPIAPFFTLGPDFALRVGTPKEMKNEFKTKNFGVGLNIGAGVEVIKHLQIGLNYAFGLTDDVVAKANPLDNEGKNRTFSVTAAILF